MRENAMEKKKLSVSRAEKKKENSKEVAKLGSFMLKFLKKEQNTSGLNTGIPDSGKHKVMFLIHYPYC